MSSGSSDEQHPKHHYPHHHHHQQFQLNWDSSKDYPQQVYASAVEQPTPYKRAENPHYTNFRFVSGNGYEERLPDAQRRVVVAEYDSTFERVRDNNHKAYEENVDAEAEEFIQLEHKKFEEKRALMWGG